MDIKPTEELMFHYPDAKSYVNVGQWLVGNREFDDIHYHLSVRPFLYPIIVLVTTSLGGFKLLWICQSIFWIATVLIVFKTVKILAGRIFAWVAVVLFFLNVSIIPATFHALTEVVILMLFSYLFYLVVKYRFKLLEVRTFHKVLLVLVIMTLIKPVFFLPTLAILILGVVIHIKNYLNSLKTFRVLIFILLPMLVQVSFIKYNFGSVNVSEIGGHTVKNYIIAQSYNKLHPEASLTEARKTIVNMNDEEYHSWLYDNYPTVFESFTKNLEDNLYTYPVFFATPEALASESHMNYMWSFFTILYKLHKFMLLIIIPLMVLVFFMVKREEGIVYLFGVLFLLYFILTTGVSFWQGDRLVLPSWGLTVVLYTLLVSVVIKILKKVFKF